MVYNAVLRRAQRVKNSTAQTIARHRTYKQCESIFEISLAGKLRILVIWFDEIVDFGTRSSGEGRLL